jgi:hypothetical protein
MVTWIYFLLPISFQVGNYYDTYNTSQLDYCGGKNSKKLFLTFNVYQYLTIIVNDHQVVEKLWL